MKRTIKKKRRKIASVVLDEGLLQKSHAHPVKTKYTRKVKYKGGKYSEDT